MSFYYDDSAEDTNQILSNEICPNCLGNDFYDDPVTGQLTCSSCFAQSQTATQEELDLNDGMDLAAQFGNRKMSRAQGDGPYKGKVARPLTEYDRSKKLPDAESCCLAFQWLLWDASKCVSKLAGIQEELELELEDGNSNQNNPSVLLFDNKEDEDEDEEEDTNDNKQLATIMERTVKDIWFKYLNAWSEAVQEYSSQYPEMRVSFRDYFLPAIQKAHLMRHLSVTIGKRVENEVLENMQKSMRKGKSLLSEEESMASSNESDIDKDDDNTSDSIPSPSPSKHPWKSKGKMYKGRPFLTMAQMVKWVMPAKPKRYPDGTYQLHPHQAVLKMQPSLTLLLAILQLACNHLQTGIAPHHLTMWVSSGQLPHALNGYAMLPSDMKEGVEMVKNFFGNSYVPPPSVIADLTGMLATACSWYGDGKDTTCQTQINDRSSEGESKDEFVLDIDSASSSKKTEVVATNPCIQKSPYNIPLLTARMVQDFGFDQTVFNNTMALMGIPNDDLQSAVAKQGEEEGSDESKNATQDQSRIKTNELPPQLDCASPEKLYTPLHIAALIVIACKLCPGWESWRITNLHANTKINNNNNDSGNSDNPEPKHVPWNEAQLQLIGNGPTLNHYLDFLEETAFGEVKPSTKMTQFFQTLEKDMKQAHIPNEEEEKNALPKNSANVTPNLILSGAHNPNIPTDSSSPLYAQYETANNIGKYTSYQYRMRGNKKILGHEPYHPHYCRLLEYICYIIEEPKTAMLHNMVEEYEKELLLPHRTKRNRKKRRKVRERNLTD